MSPEYKPNSSNFQVDKAKNNLKTPEMISLINQQRGLTDSLSKTPDKSCYGGCYGCYGGGRKPENIVGKKIHKQSKK